MEQYGLSVDRLIGDLSDEISKGNFAALRLAIEMRSMKPATKTDVTSGGQPLAVDKHAQERLASKLAKITQSKPED